MVHAPARTITLLLQGGHAVKLGDAVDVGTLVAHMRDARGVSIIEIETSLGETLFVRKDSLVGILHGPDTRMSSSTQAVGAKAPVSYYHIRDFLDADSRDLVAKRILQRENDFAHSKVSSGRQDYRQSSLILGDEVISPLFWEKIEAIVPQVCEKLAVSFGTAAPEFPVECQITAHGDGGFYHAHRDDGSIETARRVLSYVYYIKNSPDSFYGGELKIYDPKTAEAGMNKFHLVEPIDNSIVLFPSRVTHEVLPTYVPDGDFKNCRFTVNGWVRKTRTR
jgi:SM-20-related protein